MNRILAIWGIERRLFFMALFMGWGTFTLMNSLLGGLIMFMALAVFGRWATRHDPQVLRIIIQAGRSKAIYDPAKRGT